jgi:hypothetical protein
MSLRIIIQRDQIHHWINQCGTDAGPRGLFKGELSDCDPQSVDELLEAMKSQNLVLLVDEEPGKTYHKFVVRG